MSRSGHDHTDSHAVPSDHGPEAGHDHGHFDDAASTWDADPAKVERARATAALLLDALALDGTERVLEIGGGTGQLSLALADHVAAVLVTDASPGMVDVARDNIERAGLVDRLTAERLDLVTDLPPDGRFDGVWAQLALHHVREVDLLLERIKALLVPGGWPSSSSTTTGPAPSTRTTTTSPATTASTARGSQSGCAPAGSTTSPWLTPAPWRKSSVVTTRVEGPSRRSSPSAAPEVQR